MAWIRTHPSPPALAPVSVKPSNSTGAGEVISGEDPQPWRDPQPMGFPLFVLPVLLLGGVSEGPLKKAGGDRP